MAQADVWKNMVGQTFPILNHGFIRVVDYMGTDAAIVQAARVSYGVGTKKISEDRGLIRYLLRHRHTTPFEMCEIKFHVKLPIFVARQWIRHRTANVNEYSARYSILKDEFYMPENVKVQSQINKQGGDEEAGSDIVSSFLAHSEETSSAEYEVYKLYLKQGVSRELARMNLPISIYTEWYWKIDLWNLMHFLSLRSDPHAQWEIRQYANKMLEMMLWWVPLTYHAFVDYDLEAANLSRLELALIKTIAGENLAQWLKGDFTVLYPVGMSDREIKEFKEKVS